MKYLPDGIGADTGPVFSLLSPLMMSGNVWYVSSVSGTDAASPRGLERKAPLATLGQAVTNSAAGDVIVLMDDHEETISTKVTLSKQLKIIGEGRSNGNPTATLICEVTADDAIEITASYVELIGINFEAQTVTGKGPQISVEASDVLLEELYFHLGEFSEDAAIKQLTAQSRLRMKNITCVSEATAADALPVTPIVTAGQYNHMEGLVLDNGVYGFLGANGAYAYDGSAAAQAGLYAENVSLLRGADMLFHASTTYKVHVGTSTLGGKVSGLS